MTTATFTKTITAQFETVGRRQKLVGQLGEIRGESGLLIHSQLYDSKIEAEQALDDLVYELLIDYAERGLVDALPMTNEAAPVATPERVTTRHYGAGVIIGVSSDNDQDVLVKLDIATTFGAQTVWQSRSELTVEDPALATAQTLAQSLANITRVPTHVVAQNGAYLVQDETDIDCYGGRAAIVATYAPLAQTRQSQAIEQAQRRCHNCGADHRTWQCPEVGDAFAPPVYATDELVRLWGASRALLVAKLARLTPGQLTSQAIAFAAWLNEQTHADLPARSVLRVWEELINDRGPAAPALERAA